MADSSTISNTTAVTGTTPAKSNHSSSTGDLQNVQAAYRLNGKNYLKWSQLVRTFLKGRGKLSHLLGTCPKEGDPEFEAWDEQDSLVMSWSWNSMVPEISDTCMCLTTTKEIWKAVKQTFSKVSDAAQIYEIKTKISATKQGNRSITEYSNLLKSFWQEMDHYQCIQMKCSDDTTILKRFVEKGRIYDFLAGLNVEFDAVRVQILGKDDLPSLNETVALVLAEEGRRGVMIEAHPVESSALVSVSKDTNMKHFSSEQRKREDMKQAAPPRQYNKDSLWCTYCKKHRHTKETCWKLNGRPPNMNKTLSERNVSGQGQAYVVSTSLSSEGGSQNSSPSLNPFPAFNKAEIEKLKTLLGSLEQPSSKGTCSLAFSGIVSSSYVANVSDKTLSNQWVIDSGATNHMTCSSKRFLSYTPCPSHRKVTIADGSLTTVAGQGDVYINPSLTLRNVLHVPHLFTNLVSIHKLIKDSTCSVTFSSSHCVVQEQGTKKMIGHASERDRVVHTVLHASAVYMEPLPSSAFKVLI